MTNQEEHYAILDCLVELLNENNIEASRVFGYIAVYGKRENQYKVTGLVQNMVVRIDSGNIIRAYASGLRTVPKSDFKRDIYDPKSLPELLEYVRKFVDIIEHA